VARRERWAALTGLLVRRPVVTVVLAAAAVRLAVIVVVFLSGTHVPDEGVFLDVTRRVADGRGAASYRAGYGQDMYGERWLFLAPLARLADVFGPSRLPAQLLLACAGVAAAALLAATARRFLPPAGALVAGLVVALLPSQALWSSVVLMEAFVWTALTAIGWGIVAGAGAGAGSRREAGAGRRAVAPALAVCGGLLSLGWLRPQTMVVAAWAVAVAAVVIGWRRWRLLAAGLGLAAAAPLIAGLGVGGVGLVADQAPNLGRTRTLMSMGAESGLVRPSPDLTLPPELAARVPEVVVRLAAPGLASNFVGRLTVDGRRYDVLVDEEGRLYLSDESAAASARNLPAGIAVAVLRPYPGERATSLVSRLASVENLGWYALYGLAAVGLLRAPPVTRRLLAFPVAFAALYVGQAALTHGNLGIAFRQRGQALWALALLAAVAATPAARSAARSADDPGPRFACSTPEP
jgi:hypothetical protein